MLRTSCCRPLNANADVRETTRRPGTLASALISSSVMPSAKYSFSGSGLRLANGSTAIDRSARLDETTSVGAPGTSARPRSPAVENRSSGRFARVRCTTRSSQVGTLSAAERMEGTGSVICRATTACAFGPANGGGPSASRTRRSRGRRCRCGRRARRPPSPVPGSCRPACPPTSRSRSAPSPVRRPARPPVRR